MVGSEVGVGSINPKTQPPCQQSRLLVVVVVVDFLGTRSHSAVLLTMCIFYILMSLSMLMKMCRKSRHLDWFHQHDNEFSV